MNLLGHAQVIKDFDGNIYKTTSINGENWITTNLNVSSYNDGSSIRHAKNQVEWKDACDSFVAAWCYLDFDEKNGSKYGKLYNAYTNLKNIAPNGTEALSSFDAENLISTYGTHEKLKALKAKNGWGFEDRKVECQNCKDWSYSYRSKMPCNICKDTRYSGTIKYNLNGTNESGISLMPSFYEYYPDLYRDKKRALVIWLGGEEKSALVIDSEEGKQEEIVEKNYKPIYITKEKYKFKANYSGFSIRIKKVPQEDISIRTFIERKDYKGAFEFLEGNNLCQNDKKKCLKLSDIVLDSLKYSILKDLSNDNISTIFSDITLFKTKYSQFHSEELNALVGAGMDSYVTSYMKLIYEALFSKIQEKINLQLLDQADVMTKEFYNLSKDHFKLNSNLQLDYNDLVKEVKELRNQLNIIASFINKPLSNEEKLLVGDWDFKSKSFRTEYDNKKHYLADACRFNSDKTFYLIIQEHSVGDNAQLSKLEKTGYWKYEINKLILYVDYESNEKQKDQVKKIESLDFDELTENTATKIFEIGGYKIKMKGKKRV